MWGLVSQGLGFREFSAELSMALTPRLSNKPSGRPLPDAVLLHSEFGTVALQKYVHIYKYACTEKRNIHVCRNYMYMYIYIYVFMSIHIRAHEDVPLRRSAEVVASHGSLAAGSACTYRFGNQKQEGPYTCQTAMESEKRYPLQATVLFRGLLFRLHVSSGEWKLDTALFIEPDANRAIQP